MEEKESKIVVMGPGEDPSTALVAAEMEKSTGEIVEFKTTSPSGSFVGGLPDHTTFPLVNFNENLEDFTKLLNKYKYTNYVSKHAKGRAVSGEIVNKRITKKKAKRRQSNLSRKINQKWTKKK